MPRVAASTPLTAPSPFRRVLAAEVASNFGAMLSRLAIPWLATIALGATPWQMGLLLVADVAAAALGALLLGTWVDRLGKRQVMLACDVLRALLLAALAVLTATGWIAWWMLAAAAAFSGLLTVCFELARSAWIAHHIAHAELPARNAQLSIGSSLSETAAFALGGWLYQGLGAVVALVVDGLSYLVSALCLRRVPEAPLPAQHTAPAATTPWRQRLQAFFSEALAGLVLVRQDRRLRALAQVQVWLALGLSLGGTSYMIFVTRELAVPTGWQGLVFAVGGLGAVAGAALAPRLGARWGSGGAMAAGLALLAVGAALVPAAAWAGLTGALVLLLAQQIVGDGGHAISEVHDRSLRQTLVPQAMLARADAAIRSLEHTATLAGALFGGLLASAIGVRQALMLSALCYGIAAWQAMRRLRPGLACPNVAPAAHPPGAPNA